MTPFVSIVIPYHKKASEPYLHACLSSLMQQKVPMEIIVFSDAEEKPNVPYGIKLVHEEKQTHYAYKINRAMELTDKRAPYVIIAQDDLIFTNESVAGLLTACREKRAIINPISNCDNGVQFFGDLDFSKEDGRRLRLGRFFRKEDIAGFEKEIMTQWIPRNFTFRVQHNFIYCSIMLRSVWDEIGPLDELYINGVEDMDFCERARSKGIPCLVTMNAFVIHFGGVTSTGMVTTEQGLANRARFRQKFGYESP